MYLRGAGIGLGFAGIGVGLGGTGVTVGGWGALVGAAVGAGVTGVAVITGAVGVTLAPAACTVDAVKLSASTNANRPHKLHKIFTIVFLSLSYISVVGDIPTLYREQSADSSISAGCSR